MTPFRNDTANPFARESLWPRLPQTPLELGGRTRAAMAEPPRPDAQEAARGAEILNFAPAPEPRPTRRRRGLRPLPLLAATAVGVAGLTTLYLVIGLPV